MSETGTTSAAAPDFLIVQAVTKRFGDVTVLHGISYSLAAGEVLGLVGENGSGKSTAMNILGGVLRYDSGTMTLSGRPYAPKNPREATGAGIGFIHQELNIFGNLSVADNILLGRFPLVGGGRLPFIDGRRRRVAAADALRLIGLDLDPATLASVLSPGERQLVEIAKVVSRSPRVIIFDEPTTSLSAPECERLFAVIGELQRRGIGIIYISHTLADVRRVSDRVMVLRDGVVTASAVTADLPEDTIISAMVGRPMSELFPRKGERTKTDKPVISLRNVSRPGIVRDITLDLFPGEILGIAGLMGSGRTELARIIFGVDPFSTGSISINGEAIAKASPRQSIRHEVAFLTEDRRQEGLLLDASVGINLELVSVAKPGTPAVKIVGGREARAATQRISSLLRIKTRDLDSLPVRSLSGGNQQKVVIGKWLVETPKVFIMDEPTRGIDVGAKQEIYRVITDLAEDGLAVIVISSELEELAGLADRILVLSKGMIAASFKRGPAGFDRSAIMRAAVGGEVVAS